jgi:hypothetical protein
MVGILSSSRRDPSVQLDMQVSVCGELALSSPRNLRTALPERTIAGQRIFPFLRALSNPTRVAKRVSTVCHRRNSQRARRRLRGAREADRAGWVAQARRPSLGARAAAQSIRDGGVTQFRRLLDHADQNSATAIGGGPQRRAGKVHSSDLATEPTADQAGRCPIACCTGSCPLAWRRTRFGSD